MSIFKLGYQGFMQKSIKLFFCLPILFYLSTIGLVSAQNNQHVQSYMSQNDRSKGSQPLKILHDNLLKAQDLENAQTIAYQIEQEWLYSGSATADLLFFRAADSLVKSRPELSIELLDRVVKLQPAYAHGWYLRAMALLQLDDMDRAMRDLQQSVRYNPNHFQAWAAIGALFKKSDNVQAALAALREAHKIYPLWDEVLLQMNTLEEKQNRQKL